MKLNIMRKELSSLYIKFYRAWLEDDFVNMHYSIQAIAMRKTLIAGKEVKAIVIFNHLAQTFIS